LGGELGLGSYHTALSWRRRLDDAITAALSVKLRCRVLVREFYLGPPLTGKRGRGAEGKLCVLVCVQTQGRERGSVRVRKLPNASAASLVAAVRSAVVEGTRVVTSGSFGYRGLADIGFTHHDVKLAAGDVGRRFHACLSVRHLLDDWLRNAVRAERLRLPKAPQRMLNEFAFRHSAVGDRDPQVLRAQLMAGLLGRVEPSP